MSENEERGVVERTENALVTGAGSMALAMMSDEEFDARLSLMVKAQDRAIRIKKSLMKQDIDFGIIPGTGTKPVLYQPGAQKLCLAFSLVATFAQDVIYGSGDAPAFSVNTICSLHLGTAEGPVIATGVGNCNAWEKKYRYRRGERTCPKCGITGSVIKGKAEYGGGWVCWKSRNGCNAKFREDDAAIVSQVVGDIENPDIYDQFNTVVKMSKKRAYVDSVLTATGMSGEWTQDIGDEAEPLDAVEDQPTPLPARKARPQPPEPFDPELYIASFVDEVEALPELTWPEGQVAKVAQSLAITLHKAGMADGERAAANEALTGHASGKDMTPAQLVVLQERAGQIKELCHVASWWLTRGAVK